MYVQSKLKTATHAKQTPVLSAYARAARGMW